MILFIKHLSVADFEGFADVAVVGFDSAADACYVPGVHLSARLKAFEHAGGSQSEGKATLANDTATHRVMWKLI